MADLPAPGSKPSTFDPDVAFIDMPDGTTFQVLNAEGDDWDQAATQAQYDAYCAAQSIAV